MKVVLRKEGLASKNFSLPNTEVPRISATELDLTAMEKIDSQK